MPNCVALDQGFGFREKPPEAVGNSSEECQRCGNTQDNERHGVPSKISHMSSRDRIRGVRIRSGMPGFILAPSLHHPCTFPPDEWHKRRGFNVARAERKTARTGSSGRHYKSPCSAVSHSCSSVVQQDRSVLVSALQASARTPLQEPSSAVFHSCSFVSIRGSTDRL